MKAYLSVIFLLAAAMYAPVSHAEFRFPMPEFDSGYQHPEMNLPAASKTSPMLDVFALTAAMSLATWAVLKRRSRPLVFAIAIASLLYFGFYRRGCVCPVGAVQNVVIAILDSSFQIPLAVVAFFLLPLLFSLYFGRVFCGSVCPLGAIQEMTAAHPVQVPRPLDNALSLLPYAYLGLVVLALSTGSGYLICRYDPFVGFFRQGASFNMLLFGGSFLILGIFVGRPYCRYLCPYGVLLRWTSKFSKWHASVAPAACTQCRLCETACPYGAIDLPVPTEHMPERRREVKRLTWLLIAAPFIIAAAAAAGYVAHPALARLNLTVRLAERVAAEEQGIISEPSVETDAFRAGKNAPAALFADAEALRQKFKYGTTIFGGFMGFVLCGKLIRHSRIYRSADYTANRGACLSCARCFPYCPVDKKDVA
jgi:ferredoxin